MAPSRSVSRVIVASLIGTSLEWYDFFLYGSAAAGSPPVGHRWGYRPGTCSPPACCGC